MARARAHIPPSGATSARVARARSGSANAPSRSRRDARAELLRHAERAFEQAPEPVGRHLDSQWAFRYLETVRGFKPPPPPMSPADQLKLAHAQADQMVGVIRAVLEGLKLSDEDYTRGIDLAIKELRAASSQGWEPL